MLKTKIKNKLISLSDKKYLDFSCNLGLEKTKKHLGIRLPILRNYSKELAKNYELDYLLDNIDEEYYEEVMLKGMVICNYKNLSYDELFKYINYYVPKINDWALCDAFAVDLKITKKYKEEIFKLIKKYSKSKKEYFVRFSLVMILDHYIEDNYLKEIYEIINNVSLDKYYVKMANAWLISVLLVKRYDKTIAFLKTSKIDDWTYNKSIQKANESYRISEERKQELKKLRR